MECKLSEEPALSLDVAKRQMTAVAEPVRERAETLDPPEGHSMAGGEEAFRLSRRASALTISILSLSLWYGTFYVSQWILSFHSPDGIVAASGAGGQAGTRKG
jgi:hypothetical protein